MSPPERGVTVRCRAKLNLVLEILGRREDGFHDLATVMHPVDLADEVMVRLGTPGLRLLTSGIESPAGAANVAYRAADAFCEALGVEPRVEIELHKRIPAAAGLAGGSADAAGVLVGLAELHRVRKPDLLSRVAAGLGADVPFFLGEAAALAEGVGERLTPLPVADFWAVLAIAGEGVATPWAYRQVRPAHYTDGSQAHKAAQALLERGDVTEVGNAFLTVLAAERPDLTKLVARTAELVSGPAGLTGSGACVFGLADCQGQAAHASQELSAEGCWSWWGRSADRPVSLVREGSGGIHA